MARAVASAFEYTVGMGNRCIALVLATPLVFADCGGIAVIDGCFDDQSCCEEALLLLDAKCPLPDGPRECAIDLLPSSCRPFLGDIYRCYLRNPAAVACDEYGSPQLPCGTCAAEFEAAGEPCGQSQSSCDN